VTGKNVKTSLHLCRSRP